MPDISNETLDEVERALAHARQIIPRGPGVYRMDGEYYTYDRAHYRIQDALARIVAEKDARIAELEDKAKSETDARRDAFEEAAKVADQWATDQQRQFGNGGPAAAIRALAEKG